MASGRPSVLFVGGTGTISHSCVLASVERGLDVCVLNRGRTAPKRPLPPEVTALTGDVRDAASARAALGDRSFDAVVDFLTFDADQARAAVDLFTGRAAQYLFISSASVYHKPVRRAPIVESTPARNPFTAYSRDKLAAEDVLLAAWATADFPVTVVRPSHTYDDRHPPLPGDWTVVDRILRGAEVVVPGDGTSLWTLTHAADLAVGLVGLLGNPFIAGETFHITSDDAYTWDQIYETVAAAAGTRARLVHVPSDLLAVGAPDWFWSELILGDLRYTALFDNTKIRRYVPSFAPHRTFPEAVPHMLAWRAGNRDATRSDPAVDAVLDRLATGYHAARRAFAALAPGAAPEPSGDPAA
jgi:nucleoside-diphosphate-sugar epimerase